MNVDLSVNKLVVYKSDINEFKGFLIKANGSYSIRIIEVTKGIVKNDDSYTLTEPELNYLSQSEYPKLMAVSMKSWHYRLVKYVLGSNAPTPETMRNGCPYFWLLIFSLFACVFVLLGNVIIKVFNVFDIIIQKFFDTLIDRWLFSVGEEEMYDYVRNDGDYYQPNIFTKKISGNKYDVFDKFILLKYGIDKFKDFESYRQKNIDLYERWKEWRKKEIEYADKNREKYQKHIEKKMIRDAKWEARIKPIKNAFANAEISISNFFDKIQNEFTGNSNIIKNTKRFVGAIITILLLAIAFVITAILSYGIVAFFELMSTHWLAVLVILGYVIALGVALAIGFLLYSVISGFIGYCQKNKDSWCSKILFSGIFRPVAYVGLYIAKFIYYGILIPLKFIMYDFILRIVCVTIIAGSAVKIFNVIINSGGIFSDYFKASYSDYCPGIEWIDTDEEAKN